MNSYAIKVNGTGKVTVRNRVSLRKIPPPVQLVRPVTVPGEARPAGEPGSVLDVPPAPSRVTRASLKGSNLTRQNSLLDEGSSQTGKAPRQITMKPASQTGNIMKPASKAVHEEVCERTMRQVADWDTPGNILYSAFHKPPALGLHSADAGESREPVGGAGLASPREQPAGARGDSEGQDRSGRTTFRDSNDLVQEYGLVTRTSPHVSKGAAPSPESTIEVGPQNVRRSVRQKAQVIFFSGRTGGFGIKVGHQGVNGLFQSWTII